MGVQNLVRVIIEYLLGQHDLEPEEEKFELPDEEGRLVGQKGIKDVLEFSDQDAQVEFEFS